jgi:hypothetical protein
MLMKKCITILFLTLSISAFTVTTYPNEVESSRGNHSRHEFVGKIGTSYGNDAEKFGLDVSLSYMYEVDPYFACGLGLDFFWINWSYKIGEEQIGALRGDVEVETDAYTLPVFANAQIRLPGLLSSIRLEPAVTVGLGYSVMFLNYNRPSYIDFYTAQQVSKKDKLIVYGGFAWQVLASLAWRPSTDSAVNFIFDAGYRGLYPEKGSVQFDMSGVVIRLGVTIYL